MRQARLAMLFGAALVLVLASASGALAKSPNSGIQQISDAQLQALYTTVGGANPLPTTRTVAHWWGSTADPSDGTTYGYSMVGADPNSCVGLACDVTIQADITPINVIVGGMEFSGSDVVPATLDSPQFTENDYTSTPAATVPSCGPQTALCAGAGGDMSNAGDVQLQDATMRSQFNQLDTSPYHLRLDPVVHDPVTIRVPANHGILLQTSRGVIFADVDVYWWAARIQNLETKADPTHLPIYLTSDVVLYQGNPGNCCIIGFHGAMAEANGGPTHSRGNAPVQTFAWASYVSPGFFSRPDGGTDWALQDIHALSHEIAEWADDPFVNNYVEPWLTPTAPQYGCTNILETGDPVVAIGFAMGTNTYLQGNNPDGITHSADGYYHPEDEVFLPWFMRTAPNTISEATQGLSTNGGRYTLMGDLNPFAGFRAPATGCA